MADGSTSRIVAALKGLAVGDAIGKQTENLSRDGVVRWYPDGIRGFEGPPGVVLPRYAGNRRHRWVFGETTDDTERTVAVARAILMDEGEVRHTSVGRELLGCTKSVHPGVRSLWEFHQAGDPGRVVDDHDGCGAAIRVAPVGMIYGSDRIDQIVAGARQTSIPTHGGPLALAAAAATAAAVSAAIDGAAAADILGCAERAAARAEQERAGIGRADFAHALRTMHDDLRAWPKLRAADVAAAYFPD